MARTQLNSREIATTWNKERKKWPPASLDRLIGPKAVIPIMVAPRSANWVLRTDLKQLQQESTLSLRQSPYPLLLQFRCLPAFP